MTIFPGAEGKFDETLAVAVTGAEGFEELPVPLGLTIQGNGTPTQGPPTPPRLDRVKRLRDGRVLLGGPGPQDATRLEYSTDLQTWHPFPDLLEGVGLDGSPVWLDASATNAPTRFYRAAAP